MTSHHPFVSGDTRVFAIIGDPIAQAKSPALFNRLFAEIGANAIMIPMQVPATHLQAAVAGLKAVANLDGIVVTVPHKVAITDAVDELGLNAQCVGAVNCMRRLPDGRWGGEMYDGEGFVSGLRRSGQGRRTRVGLRRCCGASPVRRQQVAPALARRGSAASLPADRGRRGQQPGARTRSTDQRHPLRNDARRPATLRP